METIKKCRCCGGGLNDVIHFDSLPLAGLYYTKEGLKDCIIGFPLTITVCSGCGLIQLGETVDSSIYKEYSYTGTFSESYASYLDWVAAYMMEKYSIHDKNIIEIGSSNGYLLEKFNRNGNSVFGYEPSVKLTNEAIKRGIKSSDNYFSGASISESGFDSVDLIIIRHVLEHIDNFRIIFEGINNILNDSGLVLIESPSIEKTVQNKIYSNFFHEHLNYFSEYTMVHLAGKFGYSLIEKRDVDIHGGSKFFVFKRNSASKGYNGELTNVDEGQMRKFCSSMPGYFNSIKEFVLSNSGKGFRICGYGASHRTVMNLALTGLDSKIIKRLYDKNTYLSGKYIPWADIEITQPDYISIDKPDEIIIFAMSFEDEIAREISKNYGDSIKLISLKEYPHFL